MKYVSIILCVSLEIQVSVTERVGKYVQIGRVSVRQRCEKELQKMCEEWKLLRCQCEPKKLKLAF